MTRSASCSSADEGRFVVLVWGMDQKGQQIKALITVRDQKTARHAVAAALLELGARAHIFIAPTKDKPLATASATAQSRLCPNLPLLAGTAPLSLHHEASI